MFTKPNQDPPQTNSNTKEDKPNIALQKAIAVSRKAAAERKAAEAKKAAEAQKKSEVETAPEKDNEFSAQRKRGLGNADLLNPNRESSPGPGKR